MAIKVYSRARARVNRGFGRKSWVGDLTRQALDLEIHFFPKAFFKISPKSNFRLNIDIKPNIITNIAVVI